MRASLPGKKEGEEREAYCNRRQTHGLENAQSVDASAYISTLITSVVIGRGNCAKMFRRQSRARTIGEDTHCITFFLPRSVNTDDNQCINTHLNRPLGTPFNLSYRWLVAGAACWSIKMHKNLYLSPFLIKYDTHLISSLEFYDIFSNTSTSTATFV